MKTKQIVHTALFAALTCALTMFPSVPLPVLPGAYIHLGDAVIIISAILIGRHSLLSAAVGSTLADLFLGVAIYAPATFIIKGAMALCVVVLFNRKTPTFGFLLGAAVAEAVMIGGYFLYESALYGVAVAATTVPFALIQAGGALIVAAAVYFAFIKRLRNIIHTE